MVSAKLQYSEGCGHVVQSVLVPIVLSVAAVLRVHDLLQLVVVYVSTIASFLVGAKVMNS